MRLPKTRHIITLEIPEKNLQTSVLRDSFALTARTPEGKTVTLLEGQIEHERCDFRHLTTTCTSRLVPLPPCTCTSCERHPA